MPRPLIALVFACVLFGGCTTAPPPPSVSPINAEESRLLDALTNWLYLQQKATMFTSEEVVAELVEVGLPQNNTSLFYYAVLNQQLASYGAWAQARDAFQTLEANTQLLPQQRQLATIFKDYNQQRINSYSRVSKLYSEQDTLQRQLEEAEADKALLEEKIQALTDLETVISTRKEE